MKLQAVCQFSRPAAVSSLTVLAGLDYHTPSPTAFPLRHGQRQSLDLSSRGWMNWATESPRHITFALFRRVIPRESRASGSYGGIFLSVFTASHFVRLRLSCLIQGRLTGWAKVHCCSSWHCERFRSFEDIPLACLAVIPYSVRMQYF